MQSKVTRFAFISGCKHVKWSISQNFFQFQLRLTKGTFVIFDGAEGEEDSPGVGRNLEMQYRDVPVRSVLDEGVGRKPNEGRLSTDPVQKAQHGHRDNDTGERCQMFSPPKH